ncbi:hypothetical protein E1B28_008448 [Marasmius oreades]|uniref:Uncharacterized protein n=1 Tax=Marasmius oreades TaxID=181124 RepID=A0A9P7RYJ7_9AGAR|nr:uncharacterized protein E1B28_008448 [Marasmius oreades]KAG7092067.1 hypothetical protein E1B28_008448 [Marasmius oreades]
MRAYYRNPSNNSSDLLQPQDSGRPVSEERLRALGFKFYNVEGKTEDETLESFRQLAKNIGFDGDEIRFDFRKPTISGIPGLPEMTSKDMLEYFTTGSLFLFDGVAFYKTWNGFFDFKEPETGEYVRMVFKESEVLAFPKGVLFEVHASLENAVYVKFKTPSPLDGGLYVKGEDLENQPVRKEYLNSISTVA